MRQALLYPGEDGYWVAEVPSLPGCISQGKTKEEALLNIREAIDLYIETMEGEHLSIPNEETLGIGRSRALEQEVFDLIDEPRIR